MAGRCIYDTDAQKFWGYHDWIFGHQPEINSHNVREKILGWSASAHLDAAEIGKCIESRASEPEIRQSRDEGLALEVPGAPTVFLNGRMLEPGREWDIIKYYIEYELDAAQPERCCVTGPPRPAK